MPEASQSLTMVDIKEIFWILGMIVASCTLVVTVVIWVNKQLSMTRAQLYSRINKEAAVTELKLAQSTQVSIENRERIGLLELSNRHQESRLDGLDEKIDNVQNEVTATKDKVMEMNLSMQTNQLSLIGEFRNMSDRFISEISKMKEQQKEK